MRGPDDARVVAAVVGGNHELIGILWVRHADDLHASAVSSVGVDRADDVVAETFARSERALVRGRTAGTFPELLERLLEEVVVEYVVLRAPAASGPAPVALSGPLDRVPAAPRRPVVTAWRGSSNGDRHILWAAEVRRSPTDSGAGPRYRTERLAYTDAAARDRLRWSYAYASAAEADSLTCRRRRRDLPAYARGSLPAARRWSLERHLTTCVQCTQVASDVAFIGRTLRRGVVVRAPAAGRLRRLALPGRMASTSVGGTPSRGRLPVLVAVIAVVVVVAGSVFAGQLLSGGTDIVDASTPVVATGFPSALSVSAVPTTTSRSAPAPTSSVAPSRTVAPTTTAGATTTQTFGSGPVSSAPAPTDAATSTSPAPTASASASTSTSDGPVAEPPTEASTTFTITTRVGGTITVGVSFGWTITEATTSDLGAAGGLGSSNVSFSVPSGRGTHVVTLIAQAPASVVDGTATLVYTREDGTGSVTQQQSLG